MTKPRRSVLHAPGKQLPSGYLPTVFALNIGGFGGPSCSLQLQGETLTYHLQYYDAESNRKKELVKRFQPSERQWAQFWKAMNDVKLWNWRPDYPNPRVADGTQWSIEVQYAGRRIKSSGSNNYPGMVPNQPEEIMTSALYERYLAAVAQLLDGLRFHSSFPEGIPSGLEEVKG